MLEKKIEEYLRIKVKERGGIAYKFVSPGNAGVPDRILVMPSKGRVIFVELKSEEGKPTVNQLKQIRRLKSVGCTVTILGSIEEVDEFFKTYVSWQAFADFIKRQDEKYGV